MAKLGVIDLGTNTFHLLIAELKSDGTFQEIHREKRFVKLAEFGIETIADLPQQRGLEAIAAYQKILSQHQVENVRAFGTAALRTASNGAEFAKKIETTLGHKVLLINGLEEARLIHKGVAIAAPFDDKKRLIMDIGGGSVEFILANKTGVIWAESFPLGVSVLRNGFHENEPITTTEINTLNAHLASTLQPLFAILKQYPTQTLVGASGTFDVLENLLENKKITSLSADIDTALFPPLLQQIISANLEERYQMPGVPSDRADMIVVAILLINFILKKANIKRIIVSEYAMKEGMLSEM